MRAYNCIMRVLGWITMVAAGACLLLSVLAPGEVDVARQWLRVFPGTVVAIVVGVALLALALVPLVWWVRAAVRSDHIAFETARGRILVTLSALQDSLERTLVEEETVHDARVVILDADKRIKPLRVLAQVVIYERHDVVGLQKHLQGQIEERFNEMMTLERDVRFDVELVRIRARGRAKKGAPDAGDYFRGPQYPVNGE